MDNANKITSAVSWNLFGKSTFFILKFFESLLLVRLIGSEQYGLYGSLINVQAIAALLISLGLESAISRFVPQFKAEHDYAKLHTLMRKIIRLRTLLIAVTGIAFLFGADILSEMLFHGTLSGFYIRLVFVLVALVSFHTIFRAFLDLFFQLKFINLMDVSVQATYLAISFILVRFGYGLTGVILTLVSVNGIALIVLYIKYRREKSQLPGSSGWSEIGKKRLYEYTGTLYVLSFLNYILGKGLDVLLIGILLNDLRQVTFYLLAYNVAFYAVSVMDVAVSGNFVVSLIVEAQTQRNTGMLQKIYRGLFEFIYLFIIPIVIGGLLLSSDIIRLLYTVENLPAASFMMMFLFALAIAKLSSIASTFLVFLDKEKTIAISRAIFGIANLILDIILIPIYGAAGAVVATGSILILISIYETALLHRLIAPTYSTKFLLKTSIASMFMGTIVFSLNMVWVERLSIKIPALIMIGAGVYLGGIVLLKPVSEENIDLIKKSNLPLRHLVLRLFSVQNSGALS